MLQRSFSPNDLITREELAVILAKAAHLSTMDSIRLSLINEKLGFADKEAIHDWAKASVLAVVNAGIMGGNGNHSYFSMPLTFNSGSAQFDTKDYARSIRLNGDQIVFNLIIKGTNSVTFLSGKRISNCLFMKQE